jgi:hypothetical protein
VKLSRTLATVKSFRDYQMAHPKPGRTTDSEMLKLFRAIQRLPSVVVPAQWRRVVELQRTVDDMSQYEREELWRLSWPDEWGRGGHAAKELAAWLVCPDLESPQTCRHNARERVRRSEVLWRTSIVRSWAGLDAGGHVFWGRPE